MKRLHIMLLIAVLAVTLSGCKKEQDAPSVSETKLPAVIEEDNYKLPSLSEVRASDTPLLYDFLFGCLDWHVPIGRDTLDSDLYLLRNINLPTVVYTDWYPIQAGFTVPPLGSTIETVELSEKQADMYNTIVADLSEVYVLREGDWELVIYAGDAARAFKQYDYSFRGKYKYTDSRVPPFIVTGAGWPTEWLRREPYCTAMQEAGIDITDSWFDIFNYRGEYKLLHDDGSMNSEGYSVLCTGIREFALRDGSGGISFGMTWENVMGTCNALECNLGDFYHHGSWEPIIKE